MSPQRYHCDGLFVPFDLTRALRECEVLEDAACRGLSDHNPLVALFATGLGEASLSRRPRTDT
jgi:hypothetical protein